MPSDGITADKELVCDFLVLIAKADKVKNLGFLAVSFGKVLLRSPVALFVKGSSGVPAIDRQKLIRSPSEGLARVRHLPRHRRIRSPEIHENKNLVGFSKQQVRAACPPTLVLEEFRVAASGPLRRQ